MPRLLGLTRLDLLFALCIAVIAAAIAVPAILHIRRAAHRAAGSFDFQSIEAALNAYHQDFGDYPRNPILQTWNTMQNGPAGPPTPAPNFYSLAPALLGPGPALTRIIEGDLRIGDGAAGPGFRCPGPIQITGAININPADLTATLHLDAPSAAADRFVKNFVSGDGSTATIASITFIASPSQPYQETIGIQSVTQAGHDLALTLLAAPAYPHRGQARISVAQGKVWGPYLAADAVRVAYVPSVDAYGSPFPELGQPVLVDRWGQVIEYFPRYQSAGQNRNSVIFGNSQPASVDPLNGQEAMFDWRDGAPFFTITGQIGPAQAWPNPKNGQTASFRPELAIEWMLGVPAQALDAAAAPNEVDRLTPRDIPYILISAGPDGPDRPNGGFCNFADVKREDKPFNDSTLKDFLFASGNIYNMPWPF